MTNLPFTFSDGGVTEALIKDDLATPYVAATLVMIGTFVVVGLIRRALWGS